MAAPLIIRDQRDRPDQQEVVVMLADFSFTPPDQIFAELKKGTGMAMPAAQGGATPVSAKGSMATMPKAGAAAKPDLNDVKYDAFLANDRTLADPEVIKVEPGGRVLLRMINSSSMSAYHIDLGQLEGELLAVDGFPVSPVTARNFPIAVAQRLDIRVAVPRAPGAHPVEGEIVTPMLLANRFTINPVAVILSLIFWYWMWGVPGAILAVPMLAIIKIVSDRLRPFRAFGHLLEG
jgi:FtsP/CotA-like multicopper oxidase with cupredoxin domain